MKEKIEVIKTIMTLEERKEYVKELRREFASDEEIDRWVERKPITCLIRDAFFWGNTDKGCYYWHYIDDILQYYLYKNNL